MKPYQMISIQDCGEGLVPIPTEMFAFETPHPYQKLGAPYGEVSPYLLREGVLEALKRSQKQLELRRPGWRLKIFDAYRPIAVQQFMVDYTFQILRKRWVNASKSEIEQQVAQFWAQPSNNPDTPPPHSTGAAIDLTLVNEKGETLDLGGEIDEISARSHPNFYQNATIASEQGYHQRRELLKEVMFSANFCQHPEEWWHFSLGDQMWVWLNSQKCLSSPLIADYGRI